MNNYINVNELSTPKKGSDCQKCWKSKTQLNAAYKSQNFKYIDTYELKVIHGKYISYKHHKGGVAILISGKTDFKTICQRF